jgi:hypothetical protein
MGRLRPRRHYVSDNLESFYIVQADPAKKSVVLPGPFKQGTRGDSTSCMISNFCMDRPELFPHKVYGVQTIKSCVEVIDRVSRGNIPSHSIVYTIHTGQRVERNDIEKLTKRDMETPITLHPYRIRTAGDRPQLRSKSKPHEKMCLRGAAKRSEKAKFPSAI